MASTEKKAGNTVVETVKTIVYALLIAGIFRTLFFQPFWIPSGSMKQTLLIGDFLFVNKMAYGYSYASCPSLILPRFGINVDAKDVCGWFDGDNTRFWGGEPDRGDVVVFRHPVSGRDYIKRLVGMPGDQVQMKSGVLHINTVPVVLEDDGVFEEVNTAQGPQRLRPKCKNAPLGEGAICQKDRQIETLPGGTTHAVLNVGQDHFDNTRVFRVPEGHYFFMGDNRDNSSDSRNFGIGGVGFVPYENLIGRADRVVFSSAGRSMLFFWTWRGDRFFEKIE